MNFLINNEEKAIGIDDGCNLNDLLDFVRKNISEDGDLKEYTEELKKFRVFAIDFDDEEKEDEETDGCDSEGMRAPGILVKVPDHIRSAIETIERNADRNLKKCCNLPFCRNNFR